MASQVCSGPSRTNEKAYKINLLRFRFKSLHWFLSGCHLLKKVVNLTVLLTSLSASEGWKLCLVMVVRKVFLIKISERCMTLRQCQ